MSFQPYDLQFFPSAKIGTVSESISADRPGRVWCSGTYWPARLCVNDYPAALKPKAQVTVIGKEGITLLVVPR